MCGQPDVCHATRTRTGLYIDVVETMDVYRNILWTDCVAQLETMTAKVTEYEARCKKLPKSLRSWEAYRSLSKDIEDFTNILPLLQDLSKSSIKPRHWAEVRDITGIKFNIETGKLKDLWKQEVLGRKCGSPPERRALSPEDAQRRGREGRPTTQATSSACSPPDSCFCRACRSPGWCRSSPRRAGKEEVEEICDGADKQLGIEAKLGDIKEKWASEPFQFAPWRNRGVPVLRSFGQVIEDLEDSQLALQTMLSMRHVTPFRDDVTAALAELSDEIDAL